MEQEKCVSQEKLSIVGFLKCLQGEFRVSETTGPTGKTDRKSKCPIAFHILQVRLTGKNLKKYKEF